MSEEHDFEPVKGLPADLPQGEHILWQGSADWLLMARQVFKITWIAVYFAGLMVWRLASSLSEGQSLQAGIANALWALPLAACALGLFLGLAVINAKTTVYTITSKRVVMRFGAAMTKAINIPFKIIESASFNAGKGTSGDLAITLVKPNKIPLLLLWPHARPGKILHPQPTLRCLKDGAIAAPILAEALRKAHDQAQATPVVVQEKTDAGAMGTPALA
jgi:Bacterial PH domain